MIPPSNKNSRLIIFAFAVFTTLIGCGRSEPLETSESVPVPLVEAQESQNSEAVSESMVESSSVEAPNEADSSGIAAEPAEEQVAKLVYQPPFPDRVQLFVPPRREGSTANRREEGSVELLGFVNVDDHRVVLSINGAVYPVAVGESQLGVEVISIQPPAVVLQRGRLRWQATLEN